jgi:hypothetical protein
MPADPRVLDQIASFLEEEEACRAARAQVLERLLVRDLYERFSGPGIFCQFFQQVRIWRTGWFLGSTWRAWVWAVARRQVGKWRIATNVRSTTK